MNSHFSITIDLLYASFFFLPDKKEGLEQVAGIEPALSAWQAEVLTAILYLHKSILPNLTVNGELVNLSTYWLVRLACTALLT